jgi:cytochrome c oxidase subunit 4
MHALYESALVRVILAGGVLWFLILMTLTMTDYLTRSQ